MNRRSKYDYIVREIECVNKSIYDKMERVLWIGRMESMIELDDGSLVLYDSLFGDFRLADTPESMIKSLFPEDDREWSMEFSKRLYREMIMAGCYQDEVAERIDISRGALSNYMNGVSSPNIYILIKLFRQMRKTEGELIRVLCYGEERYESERKPVDGLPSKEEWTEDFSLRIHKLMKRKGWTQTSLSKASGISQVTISRYVSGITIPTALNLVKIARAMKLNKIELGNLICYI